MSTQSWAFDFKLFIFHALQYNYGNTVIILQIHLHQSARENFWINTSALSVVWLMQACIFARRRLYLTDSIPKKILSHLPQMGQYSHLRIFILCMMIYVRELFHFTFHIYRISKEWPVTGVKGWKGNAGIIYSISSSCSTARISWEIVVILLLKSLPAARVSELSYIGCSSA